MCCSVSIEICDFLIIFNSLLCVLKMVKTFSSMESLHKCKTQYFKMNRVRREKVLLMRLPSQIKKTSNGFVRITQFFKSSSNREQNSHIRIARTHIHTHLHEHNGRTAWLGAVIVSDCVVCVSSALVYLRINALEYNSVHCARFHTKPYVWLCNRLCASSLRTIVCVSAYMLCR